jgi:cob(I)alamin adenosyltransferase
VSDQAARQERHTEPITIALDHLLAQDRFEQPYVRAANVALDALLAERDALAAQLEQTREALRRIERAHASAQHLQEIARAALVVPEEPSA